MKRRWIVYAVKEGGETMMNLLFLLNKILIPEFIVLKAKEVWNHRASLLFRSCMD